MYPIYRIRCCALILDLNHTYVRLWSGLENVVDLLQDFRSELRNDVEGLEVLRDLLRLGRSQNNSRGVGVHRDPGESEASHGSLKFLSTIRVSIGSRRVHGYDQLLTLFSELGQLLDLTNLLLSLGRFKSSDSIFEELWVSRVATVVWNTVVVLMIVSAVEQCMNWKGAVPFQSEDPRPKTTM